VAWVARVAPRPALVQGQWIKQMNVQMQKTDEYADPEKIEETAVLAPA